MLMSDSAQAHVSGGFSLHHGPHHDAFSVQLTTDGDGMVVRSRTFELVGQEIRAYKTSSESDIILTGKASLVGAKDCLIEVETKPPMAAVGVLTPST